MVPSVRTGIVLFAFDSIDARATLLPDDSGSPVDVICKSEVSLELRAESNDRVLK